LTEYEKDIEFLFSSASVLVAVFQFNPADICSLLPENHPD
jgi:hypothetical protein